MEAAGPLILTATFQAAARREALHRSPANNGSSWGQHSIYQKLAPLPEELQKQWGFPNQSEASRHIPDPRGDHPAAEYPRDLPDAGVSKATLQPENKAAEGDQVADGVEVVVPELQMHSMVVFE